MPTHNQVIDAKGARGQGRLFIAADVQGVLEGAIHKGNVTDYGELALRKCTVKGWIQFEGEDGETLGLTASGKDVCERFGFK